MEFTPVTQVAGSVVVDLRRIEDDRGFFARVFAEEELAAAGLPTRYVHANVGYSIKAGTLRGLHFQRAPHAEAKLVRCTRGAAFDVAVDLRPESPTYANWFGVELTADNHRLLFVPEGCAHGYLTLADDTEIVYQATTAYAPEAAAGLPWDDPAFGIIWPAAVGVISDHDRTWPPFVREESV